MRLRLVNIVLEIGPYSNYSQGTCYFGRNGWGGDGNQGDTMTYDKIYPGLRQQQYETSA